MKTAQLAISAVALCALGLVVVRWVDRTAPGRVWAVLAGIYYFGGLGALVLRRHTRPICAWRYAIVGLLAGIVPGLLFAVAEDLSAAQPNNAVELGSIICTATLGALVGFGVGFCVTPTAGTRDRH